MKNVRYYTKTENEVYIHDEPTLEASAVCSIEYDSSISDVKKRYSNFDIRRSWRCEENEVE